MTAEEARKAVQLLLHVDADGIIGKRSQAAFNALAAANRDDTWPPSEPLDLDVHRGKATSFADPADIRAFRRCKDAGGTDEQCLKVGDNGIGCWGDDVSEGSGKACAVPPDDMIKKWGSVDNAKYQTIEITANGKAAVSMVKDRMRWKRNITNNAVVDMNPDTCAALDLTPPVSVNCEWRWT